MVKGHFPRCCGKPMKNIWVNTGRTGKKGGTQTRYARSECEECGRKI